MKIPLTALFLLFAVCAFARATAGTPIVGIPVGLEGDPGSFKVSADSDQKGKFSFALPAGKYKLTIPFSQVAKALTADKDYGKNPAAYEISVNFGSVVATGGAILDRWGNLAKAPEKVILTARTGAISITIPKGGATLTGTLTCTKSTSFGKAEK